MPAPTTDHLLSLTLSKVKYLHPDQTKRDVLSALHHYRGLIPKQDKFIFNDGVQRDLINIYGTIPVPYKGQNYNIPISLWLLDTHPFHAPICYVKPTADMQIKVSKHVDHSGKIYLPYLHEWSHPACDLLGLIQICIVTFSEQPPVYSKPKDGPALPYPGQAGYGYGQAYPPPQYNTQYSVPTTYPVHTTTATHTIMQEQAKTSIISAAEDTIKIRLREEVSTKNVETESLKQVGEELSIGRSRLTQMISKLKLETEQVDTNIRILTEKEAEMSAVRDKLANTGEVSCDEAVIATAPIYNQLIMACAEESAIEDAIYFLGEALRRGVIDCELFLKHVRNMSRKQFMLRATMQKCRQVAGLQL